MFLDSAASSQRPRQVIDAIVEMYEKHYANVHRGIHWLSDQSTDRYEVAREKVRKFVRAPGSHEVIFTRGTTESINLVARSYGDAYVKAGDEIVVTEMEHHSNLVPWHQLAERTGAAIRHIGLADDGTLLMDNLDALFTGSHAGGGGGGGVERVGNRESDRADRRAGTCGGSDRGGRRGAERAARCDRFGKVGRRTSSPSAGTR